MEQYPTLHFVMRYGAPISYIATALGIGAGLWATIVLGDLSYVAAGVVIGSVAYGLVRSYVELIALVTDMLQQK